MSLEEIIPLAVPVVYVLLFVSEARMTGRQFPDVRRWKFTGACFFVMLLGISLLIPHLVPLDWMRANSLADLAPIGLWGVPLGLLLTTLITYWFHRAEHRFNLLWRMFHQLHHSALRIDIAGAFYTHPLEPAAKMLLGASVAVLALGLDPVAAATVSTLSGLLSMFQHWNVTTPRWLGFIIPRPESHCLHHERGVHARNYGDLPVWDMLFGTYLNPRAPVIVDVGFGDDEARRMGQMLLMRDVGRQPIAGNAA